MENRVYYGEYSLKHWIDLILTRNIELPDYQRHFVWLERDIKRFIKSLKEKQFVQPVTIALYNVGEKKRNLILDGQQRLTSVLLAYIGYFPDRKKFLDDNVEILAGEDDSALEESDTPQQGPILWKFIELLKDRNSKDDIVQRIKEDGRYSQLTDPEFTNLTDEFFVNTFIGFSFIVPESIDQTTVQTVFSKLFRNINYFGKKLDALESRKSLYFQNADLVIYFDGKLEDNSDVLCDIKIMENLQPYKIDFVRYLSILSQYSVCDNDINRVLVGYSAFSSRESYYADYVSFILGQGDDEQESRPDKFRGFNFSEIFPNSCWKLRFSNLKNAIERIKPNIGLNEKKSFSTWMEADYWLFGLIYYIVFDGKTLTDTLTRTKEDGLTTTLEDEIKVKINSRKSDTYYMKNTNRLGNLRERLRDSSEIYSHYVQ